ncbi:Uncharacterized protein Rs2_35525 [Raphanus sativus]|nr:Uncharacterized protein Rs2_35525 [Raphanus sativus]
MPPKTRLAMKRKKRTPEKNKSPATKKKSVTEKKKNAAAVKRRELAARKKRDAVKKKRETARKKKSGAAEKKRKQDSGVDGESSTNPNKRAQNRVRETVTSPPVHQGHRSHAPSDELPSQADREPADMEVTPSPVVPSEPQKSTTPAPSEAENPVQPPITSLLVSGSSPKSLSHRVDNEGKIHNEDEEIGSNNRDSPPPHPRLPLTMKHKEW